MTDQDRIEKLEQQVKAMSRVVDTLGKEVYDGKRERANLVKEVESLKQQLAVGEDGERR